VKATREQEAVRRSRDEDPLESPFDDDDVVERCWGYEMPVRHRAPTRREPLP
jgi:hypothetical protein